MKIIYWQKVEDCEGYSGDGVVIQAAKSGGCLRAVKMGTGSVSVAIVPVAHFICVENELKSGAVADAFGSFLGKNRRLIVGKVPLFECDRRKK